MAVIEKIRMFGENCVHYGAVVSEDGKREELERHLLEEGEVCTALEGDAFPKKNGKPAPVRKGVDMQVFNARQSALKGAISTWCTSPSPFASVRIILETANEYEKWLLR